MQMRQKNEIVFRALSSSSALAMFIAATCSATSAAAQEQSQDLQAQADATANDDRVQAATANEIIVSARRRSESLQDTPVAITAIQPAQLEAKGTLNIGDLQGTAPNLLISQQPSGSAAANISIRGIAFADVEKSFDPAVGVYVDDVYIGTSTGQYLDFFDIDSIEVLRGPQGTLFGRNTIAGVINIRRTKPTMDFNGKFEASIARFDTVSLKGVVNIPIVRDKLGLKLFQFHTETGGYYKDAVSGKSRGANNSENFGAALRYNPSNDLDMILTLEKQDQNFRPAFSSLLIPGDSFCGAVPAGACGGGLKDDLYTSYGNFDNRGYYKAKGATLNVELGAGPVEITSVTSYRKSDEEVFIDFGTAGLFASQRPQTYDQFSQEIRFAGNLIDGLDYVSGLYYFKSKYEINQNIFVFGNPSGSINTIGKSESYAGFFDFNWSLIDTVRLSGGGRWTKDRKRYQFPLIFGDQILSNSWSKFTPKVTLDWRPNQDLMIYGTWSRGYRSGGYSGRAGTQFSASQPYAPENVDSFELGAKTTWLNGLMTFNIAGFYTDYNGIQQSSTITAATAQGLETIVVNAAGAKIKGIEADFSIRPVTGLSLRAAMGYTDAEFNGFIVGQPITRADGTRFLQQIDYSAVDPIFAPKWTLSFNGDYTVPVGDADLTFTAGYRHIASYDQQIAPDPSLLSTLRAQGPSVEPFPVGRNDPRVRSDAQNLVDLSVSAKFPMDDNKSEARMTVFVRNVLDDRGPAYAFAVAAFPNLWHYGIAREPRTYGVSFGFEF